jgi:hypothetical protein
MLPFGKLNFVVHYRKEVVYISGGTIEEDHQIAVEAAGSIL